MCACVCVHVSASARSSMNVSGGPSARRVCVHDLLSIFSLGTCMHKFFLLFFILFLYLIIILFFSYFHFNPFFSEIFFTTVTERMSLNVYIFSILSLRRNAICRLVPHPQA
jgi:hypothetical protein